MTGGMGKGNKLSDLWELKKRSVPSFRARRNEPEQGGGPNPLRGRVSFGVPLKKRPFVLRAGDAIETAPKNATGEFRGCELAGGPCVGDDEWHFCSRPGNPEDGV